MTANRLLALSVAAGALASAALASAQTTSPDQSIKTQSEGAVVYRNDPVVQPIAGADTPPAPSTPAPAPAPVVAEERVAEVAPPLVAETHSAPATVPHAVPRYPAPPHYPVPAYASGYPYSMPPQAIPYPGGTGFDRDAWLDDCRERIQGVDRKNRAGVIGGLLGAVAGGFIGNRIWDSQRLGGTLLGAGIGGLAGAAAGSAIGAAGDRRSDDECAVYLDRHMAAGHPGFHYPGNGYGYPAVAYVPVMVQVPQRAIVREYVTEEWVDDPTATRSTPVAQPSIVRQPAPAPRGDKRTKVIRVK